MRKAREMDSSGLEAKRRSAQVEFDLRIAQLKRQKDEEKKRKEISDLQDALTVELPQTESALLSYNIKQLDERLNLLQRFGNDTIIPKTRKDRGLKADKQKLLKAANLAYQTRLSEGAESIQFSIRKLLLSLEAEERPKLDPTQTNYEDPLGASFLTRLLQEDPLASKLREILYMFV
ncbi:hypothetical protein BDZ97DRAFT_1924090 [Flammula alnicola]|nr:hypothetical protein BDZ97DRAFT_1924090 [Flammula alnicola]